MKLFWGHSQDFPLSINQLSLCLWEQLFQTLQQINRQRPYTQKNVVPLVFLFTFMPVKEEMERSFTLQKKFPQIWHTHLQNVSALFHTLREGGVTHISPLKGVLHMFSCSCLSRQQKRSVHSTPATEPSNMNIETILLLLVRDDSSTQLKWN